MENKDWFATWFDTPYYHILYKKRDDNEAKQFIKNLTHWLRLEPETRVLDLACGKGRHARILNDLGMTVKGVDLSENSIKEASKYQNDTLTFEVHDMREILNEEFDAVFNLFTSFGYFDCLLDNAKVIQCIHKMLREKGLLVIDFMNSKRVVEKLISQESKIEDGIHFQIERRHDGKHIYKDIQFHHDNRNWHFTERVQSLLKLDFEELLNENQFEILSTFGDFDLNEFDENNSDRLIIIARKTA